MDNEEQLFSTRDLYLASTLVTLKFLMVGVDFQIEGDKTVGYFKFSDSEGLQDARRKYSQGLLAIEPKTFVTSMHSLKAEVSNVYKSPHSAFNRVQGK